MPHVSGRNPAARRSTARWTLPLWRCTCVLLLAALCAARLHAADRRYFFNDHGGAEGLAQHSVETLSQDRTGYIWIGTQGGLHKFDGYSYALFRHTPDDPNSLPDSFVTALAQDDTGRLWVGGRIRGRAVLDPLTGKAETQAPVAGANAEARRAIGALAFDPKRGLWIGTGAGLE